MILQGHLERFNELKVLLWVLIVKKVLLERNSQNILKSKSAHNPKAISCCCTALCSLTENLNLLCGLQC